MRRSLRRSIQTVAEETGRWILSSPTLGKRTFRTREGALNAAREAAAEAEKSGQRTGIRVRPAETPEPNSAPDT